MASMHEQLEAYLDTLARDACYRVDLTLKETPYETTERVFFVGSNGAEQGPFVRKKLDPEAGLGAAYARLWEAQQAGKRFLYLPHLIDYYSTGDSSVVVMEYIEGETLAEAIWRLDPSEEFARNFFGTICDAVIELHERFHPPLIHRDLKPSNIMLNDGAVTIIDLGIAREFDDDAAADTHRFGTRSYAPPEQFGYGQTDERSDIYALGMILYYCLTESVADAEIMHHNFEHEKVPESLRPILIRATAFDPAARYASVRDLRDAFNHALVPKIAPAPLPVTAPASVPISASSMPLPSTASPLKTAPAAPRQRSHLLRIPHSIGLCWNFLLVFTWLAFATVVTMMIFEPAEALAVYQPPGRFVMGWGIFGIATALLAWLLADKRGLRQKHLLPAWFTLDNANAKLVCILLIVTAVLASSMFAQFFIS